MTKHKPVMLDEVLEYLNPQDGETYIDATFGAGGYSNAILEHAACQLVAIDQDPSVKEFVEATRQKHPERFKFIEGNFGDLDELFSESTEKFDGIVFDIGVSSMQIDTAERGFSFMKEGPLDMRMGNKSKTAAEFLNSENEKNIADIIYKYGEEKSSRRIAKEIVNSRPLHTTKDLVDAVHRVLGSGGKINSATRTFQAVRIHVNQELEMLERGLEAALRLLKNGGRLVVVTFHSLEDRIVKMFFKKNSSVKEQGNRHMFFAPENDASTVQNSLQKKNEEKIKLALEIITKKAIMPKDEEIMSNPRARSAKLRAATKKGV